MEYLKELVNILNRKRLTRIDVLDKTFLKQSNNMYYRFYDILDKNMANTDIQAAQLLYGTDKPDAAYRKLKSRFKNKLLKTLLLIDPEEYFQNNEKNKNYYECITTLNTVEILVKIKGVNKTVIELIKDNYSKAEEYKFYEILKSYSYYLLSYYSLSGDSSNYMLELSKFKTYNEYANNEMNVKQLNSRITLFYSDPKPINRELLKEIESYIIELKNIIDVFPDPESKFFYYHSLLAFKESSAAYSEIIEITNLVENLLDNNPIIASAGRRTIIKLYKIRVQLHLKNYNEGIRLIKDSESLLPDNGSYNWFLAKDFEFKLHLHNHNISAAYKIYNEVTENKFFKRSYSHLIDKWRIYEAYLIFLDNYLNKGDYKFSIAKFLNDVSFYTKDKSGFNFAVRVIEILFLFAKKQYNIVFTKTDALKVYRTRYLNDDTYLRSRMFLSALLKAEKEGFITRIMRKGYPEVAQLKSKDQHFIIADWEVLPYEMVWDILVELAKE